MLPMITLRGHHLDLLYNYWDAKEMNSLESHKRIIIRDIRSNGHSYEHALNIIDTLEKALQPGQKIKFNDTIDDICQTCDKKEERECVEYIPYDYSHTTEDRGYLWFYNLQRRVYTTAFIQKRLKEKGRFP